MPWIAMLGGVEELQRGPVIVDADGMSRAHEISTGENAGIIPGMGNNFFARIKYAAPSEEFRCSGISLPETRMLGACCCAYPALIIGYESTCKSHCRGNKHKSRDIISSAAEYHPNATKPRNPT